MSSMRSASSSTTYSTWLSTAVLGLDVVEQAAGRGDQHLDAGLELGVCGFMSMPPNTTGCAAGCAWRTS
jgi:hypothetical protein